MEKPRYRYWEGYGTWVLNNVVPGGLDPAWKKYPGPILHTKYSVARWSPDPIAMREMVKRWQAEARDQSNV